MRPITCVFGHHDWIWDYSPGVWRVRCLECGATSTGVPVPTAHVEPPVVKVRKRRKPKAPKRDKAPVQPEPVPF